MTWGVWDARASAWVCPPRLPRWHAEFISDALSRCWGEPDRFHAARAKESST